MISCLILRSWVWVSRAARSFIALTLTSSYFSSSTFSEKFSTSTVVAMKLTRNWKLSIDFMAPTASLGAKEDALMMAAAFSLRDSAIIMVLLSFSGTISSTYVTLAVMYGS